MPGHIVVEEFPQQKVTASGVHLISDPDLDTFQGHGIVKRIGPPRRLENGTLLPSEVTPGQEIYFSDTAGSLLKFEGKEFLLIPETAILAIVE